MKKAAWLSLLVIATLPVLAQGNPHKSLLARINARIAGHVIDHTANHGVDRRIYSPALQQPRDVYVYLPPGFDPTRRYPLMIVLHGYLDDETSFVKNMVDPLDEAIRVGRLPPMIVAAPDGTLTGTPSFHEIGSFFINSPAGNYQDWVVQDVWEFLLANYPIRPEREAHAIAGVSMGGYGAYNIAIKHPDRFKIVIGIMPVLNLRWVDLEGNYMANFGPNNWGWRNCADDPREVVGCFLHGLFKIRMKSLYPIFGRGPAGMQRVIAENPIEMIDRYQNGKLDMFIGYAGQDEFNLDAHAESFLYYVRARGIEPAVWHDPKGSHSEDTALRMVPALTQWLGDRLRAYHCDGTLPGE